MTDLTDRTTIDAAATAAGWAIEERGDWDAEHDQTTVDYTRGEHLTITAYYGQRGRQLGYAELYVPDFDSSTGGRFADDTDRRRFPRRPAQTPLNAWPASCAGSTPTTSPPPSSRLCSTWRAKSPGIAANCSSAASVRRSGRSVCS